MDYRLGLDLGTNSIGWCVVDLDGKGRPVDIRDSGVRIFSDGRNPKDKTSLAVARRMARSMRRRRDRYLRRQKKLLSALAAAGLMPDDPVARKALTGLDPYAIRAGALDAAVPLHHLGRALFHLNQRRGFKSNRRTDGAEDDERGKIRQGVNKLRDAMTAQGARTLGEFLHRLQQGGGSVRVRLKPESTDSGKTVMAYELYPDRAMVLEEFEALWDAQAPHHPAILTAQAREKLRDIIFFQRRLKPVRPGKCTFNPEEERLPRAHPLFQRRRIFQDANTLAVIGLDQTSRGLTQDERDKVALALLTTAKRTFGQIRRLLKLPPDSRFNLESETRKDLKGDETAAALAKDDRFGSGWRALPLETQAAVVEHLLEEEEEEPLLAWLTAEQGLSAERAESVVRAALPDGHGELGLTATRKILTELERGVVPYSKAAELAGYHHSDFRDGVIHDALPYYGRVLERHVAFGSSDPGDSEEVRCGRIANPTVHIALNQLRRLINAVIARHGHPAEIIVELARELKLSRRQLDEVEKGIKDNTARAERHREILAGLNLPDRGESRMRLRLWEELNFDDPLDRRCPYTGEPISPQRLFSAEVEIDHILPFSRTLDNSAANKTVGLRRANREKRNRTPFEAFGHQPGWDENLERLAALPRNKRWRFGPDAMERFETQERDFLDRQLTDTQYLSRIAREYMTAVCDPRKVWATPGRLTELLRRSWGLNDLLPDHNIVERQDRKNRLDHRHHAVDAAVVGVTDRALLNAVSRAAARAEEQDLTRLVDGMPLPFEGFRDRLRATLERMTVSHRPDRGTPAVPGSANPRGSSAGRLHNDTAYGLAGAPDARGARLVVHRVPLDSLKDRAAVERVRDAGLRQALLDATEGLSGKDFAAALAAFAARDGIYKGLRRVRVLERLKVIPVCDKAGRPYKAYKGDANYRFDVWELQDGRWKGEAVSMFQAHQPDWRSTVKDESPTARKVLRLHKGDLLATETGKDRVIRRVVKFSANGSIQLAAHNEAGNLKARDVKPPAEDYFKYINTSASGLKKLRARQVRVDATGRLFDPGPRG
ncbi:type II CRISPR RNA-guided endonuclease Cas9 [Pelagibius litoralis]|uniref:CRISPR-associated endonuclease Cas9 n=1 Tax=Pelagibius litoralis TaxID=374515 RepID=A0A967EVH0_9PROT|nr:type II CRISPR RNA-guided endonuclease Cas9 [Pelagibius litoralis]NIA68492.1 type II CRISPR RNA-guided endonuclease Cas9 [Pelagibius litoralis]